ncbi:GNAT family N-acetyltransferase [Sulfidibacter corallicola]|uniref:GNAT family N-acetyltransferase n=1 Tax=Sulfidibacter corallicola TaxID=2818388 RepID=A0A8A4TH56_SULCO|nr:GNAT family N-acetyltransferase [Sulfidibacter corallicola]QTD48847.1 GNAT family N-acetyltransferase [Sulfidibacter corallicola]
MQWSRSGIRITTDLRDIDLQAVHAYLTRSAWSPGISLDRVEKAAQNSVCFGLLDGNQTIGFARMVTDRATFAYLCDVYILEAYRGRGLSKWLMETVMNDPEFKDLRRVVLCTSTAHGLYHQFGFASLAKPEIYMEIHRPDVYQPREDRNMDHE